MQTGNQNLSPTASARGAVFVTRGPPRLPDASLFIIEGGVAGVVDKGPDTRLSTVFQDDVRELALFHTEDEHSQVS